MTLPVHISEQASLDNYLACNKVVAILRDAICQGEPHLVLLLGAVDSGKSHLMFGACQLAESLGRVVHYLPAREIGAGLAAASENVTGNTLLCIDDIDDGLAQGFDEVALFNLYNQQHLSGGQLLISSRKTPEQMDIHLADLQSRLKSGLSLRLAALDDGQKQQALQLKAAERGLQLSDESASYIMRRSSRDLGQLVNVLDTLDKASLREKRKLTVPFIKQVLGW